MKKAGRTAVFLGLAALVLGILGLPDQARAATNVFILDVPDYNWFYACMGTAAGNLMGYWDRHGFPDFYTGRVNGGVAPLNTIGANQAITSMWASKAGVDGRLASKPGHVDDYYIDYEAIGPDPYVTAGHTEHVPDCIGDFIGMDQLKWTNMCNECDGNIDGFCFVAWDPSGARRINYVLDPASADPDVDVQTGLRAWAQWRGYGADVFTQLTDFNPHTPTGQGFTFADMQAEIDAGYPVLLFLQPYDQYSRSVGSSTNVNPEIHSMLAYGYYISGGVNYVRYRTSWASGDNSLKVWNSQLWEASLPVRGVIGFHPTPKIRRCSLAQGALTLGWDGPASLVCDATLRTTNRVHGYVVEMSTTCAPSDFQAVSGVVLTNRYTIPNCPSPVYLRLRLVRP